MSGSRPEDPPGAGAPGRAARAPAPAPDRARAPARARPSRRRPGARDMPQHPLRGEAAHWLDRPRAPHETPRPLDGPGRPRAPGTRRAPAARSSGRLAPRPQGAARGARQVSGRPKSAHLKLYVLKRVSYGFRPMNWTTTFTRFPPGSTPLGPVAVHVEDWSRPRTGGAPMFDQPLLERLTC